MRRENLNFKLISKYEPYILMQVIHTDDNAALKLKFLINFLTL